MIEPLHLHMGLAMLWEAIAIQLQDRKRAEALAYEARGILVQAGAIISFRHETLGTRGA